MAYGRGFGAVQAAAEQAANYTPGVSFNITHPIQQPWNLSWKEGETKVVRFLSDELVSAPFYDYIATLDGKRSEFVDTSAIEGPLKRPDRITATYKNDKNRPLRPMQQYLGMVIERELVPGTKNEYQDVPGTFETLSDPDDPNSEKISVKWPRFWIIRKGRKFWDLMNEFYVEDDRFTTVDRNYKIKRLGSGTSTTYMIREVPPNDSDSNTTEALVEEYGIPAPEFEDTTGYEQETLDNIAKDPVFGWTIKFLERRATPQWFEKIFKSEEKSDTKPENNEPEEPVSAAAVGNLKDRLSSAKTKKYQIAK